MKESMIWTPDAQPGKQVYAVFRKTFNLEILPEKAFLHIFTDSRYVLWINGRYAEQGPCRFDPSWPEYDTLNVRRFLKKGKNAIVALVHHYAGGGNGRIMEHIPGLAAQLDVRYGNGILERFLTDNSWLTSVKTRYLPSPPAWGVIPDNIDARRDDGDWLAGNYNDSGWSPAIRADSSKWGTFLPRTIPLLKEIKTPCKKVIRQSINLHAAGSLPQKITGGNEVYIDFGKLLMGYSILKFKAKKGTRIAIRHGHYFKNDKMVYCHSPLNRYIAKEGMQTYMSGDILAFRYLAVKVKTGFMTLLKGEAVNRRFPYKKCGTFKCSETKMNKVWNACIDTVLLCSEDSYTDCAIRERAEWTADTVMCSYPISKITLSVPEMHSGQNKSDASLLRKCLTDIAHSRQPDDRIKAHHPSDRWDIHGYIEDYACLWVRGLKMYIDSTGDIRTALKLLPVLERQMEWFSKRLTERGLLHGRDFVFVDNPLCYKTGEFTTLNAFVYDAFLNTCYLSAITGNRQKALKYKHFASLVYNAINSHLWNEKSGTYDGGFSDGQRLGPTVHAALIALYFNAVPAEKRKSTEKWLLENYEKTKLWPYLYFYLFKVFYDMDRDDIDCLILNLIRKNWYPLIDEGLTAVFENFGEKNCKDAFVHQMGSAPAFFLSSWVLGVRMDNPASDKQILIEPHLGDLKYAEGIVLTEFGEIPVLWEKSAKKNILSFKTEIPEGIHAVLSIPKTGASCSISLNGRNIQETGGNRRFKIKVKSGKWEGKVAGQGYLYNRTLNTNGRKK